MNHIERLRCARNAHLAHPNAQRGLGLLQVMLFVSVLGGMGVAGYLQWKARETLQTARAERSTLAQADRALVTFATANHRLPCPDTNRSGLENCTGSEQKGWLPSITLQLAGADPGVTPGQLRYMVQRGNSAFDLAVSSDDWRPLGYDEGAKTFQAMRDTSGADAYAGGIQTLADLCFRIDAGARATLAAGMAQVASTPARAVAYALVHPGLANASGNADNGLFEAANSLTGASFADPARVPTLAAYDDVVLERSFDSLQTAFACEPLVQSINTVALGLDVVDQVDGMREDNIKAATQATVFAGVGAAITAVELSASVVEAASDAGNAAVEATLCGVSLGLAVNACAAFPQHIATAVLAGGVTVARIATIALNIAAAVKAGEALALADSSKPPGSIKCPPIDLSRALSASTTDVADARTDLAKVKADLATKKTELATATTAKANAVAALRSALRYGQPTASELDGKVDTLLAAADDWDGKAFDYSGAQAATARYASAIINQNAQIVRYDQLIANRLTMIPTLEAEITELDKKIAAETDETKLLDLRKQRANKAGELGLLNDPVVLQDERDKAVVARDKAIADKAAADVSEATASTSASAARVSYATAYAALRDGSQGPYWIGSAAAPTVRACTRGNRPLFTCPNGSVETSGNVANALIDLMGVPSSITGDDQPHADSKFRKPKKLAREVAGLESAVSEAEKRVTDAVSRYDDLRARTDNPPVCNITGSAVTPWAPAAAEVLLEATDRKGGTR